MFQTNEKKIYFLSKKLKYATVNLGDSNYLDGNNNEIYVEFYWTWPLFYLTKSNKSYDPS